VFVITSQGFIRVIFNSEQFFIKVKLLRYFKTFQRSDTLLESNCDSSRVSKF
jgi:hypothetical protein